MSSLRSVLLAALAPFAAHAQDAAFIAPVAAADGAIIPLQAMICRPDSGAAPARLVVIAHGSPAHASDRPGMTPMS